MIISSPATFTPKIPWVPARPNTDSLPLRMITTIAKSCFTFLRITYEICCLVAKFFKNPYRLNNLTVRESTLSSSIVEPVISYEQQISPEKSPDMSSDNSRDMSPVGSPEDFSKTPQQTLIFDEEPITPLNSTRIVKSPGINRNETKPGEITLKQEATTAWKIAGCVAFLLAGVFAYSLLFAKNINVLEEEIFLLKEQVTNLTHRLTTAEETFVSCQGEAYKKGLFEGVAAGKSFCIKALMQNANKMH